MQIIQLTFRNDAIVVDYLPKATEQPTQQFVIAYNPKQSLGENLENIKVRLAGLSIDAAIIENALSYPFSDTVVGINYNRIDVGLALTNLLNIPAVSRQTVDKVGLEQAVTAKRDYLTWHLDYFGQYTGKRNRGQEAMLTVGNGYYGVRGAYVESHADKDNYPGTYVAGVYNQLTSQVADRSVVNEDLVNLPNGQFITFGVDGQAPFTINEHDVQDVYRSLDLRSGILTTSMIVQLASGHQIHVQTKKLANMQNWHRLAIQYQVTPINFDGTLQIYSEIDGSVKNGNVDRYNVLNQQHLQTLGMESNRDAVQLAGQTVTSKVNYAIGATLVTPKDQKTGKITVTDRDQVIQQRLSLEVKRGQTYSFEKNVVIYTTTNQPDQITAKVAKELQVASFTGTVSDSRQYWHQLWDNADIQIQGDITSQRLTRVNIYHTFVSAEAVSPAKLDASVGARGLHGEAYRGHVFWDEMFVLPYYTVHYPELAKQLLLYRYHRLPAARKNATDADEKGAMFPWQSGMYGDEQSQSVHLNPITQTWDPDNSRLQRHVSLAVAYDVWIYYHYTHDKQFLADYGLEMLQSIAEFWLNKAQYSSKTKRYTIRGVMGPDEFHENYPNSKHPGLRNNAYTNLMVAWLFGELQQLRKVVTADQLAAADDKSGFTSANVTAMTKVGQHLSLDINNHGIIGQFEGYFKLPTLDFNAYRQKYGDISRMDRILKAEGKTPDAYQVAKQADALMAFYNFDVPTVENLVKSLGYQLPKEYLTKNISYYLARTTHGSTLSRIVYAVLDEIDGNLDQAWKLFSEALFSDYYDIQGGTTAEGIHLGVMGATLEVEMRHFAGVSAIGDQIDIEPQLPDAWQGISFKEVIRGIHYEFNVTHTSVTVQADKAVTVTINHEPVKLTANQAVTNQY